MQEREERCPSAEGKEGAPVGQVESTFSRGRRAPQGCWFGPLSLSSDVSEHPAQCLPPSWWVNEWIQGSPMHILQEFYKAISVLR